MENKIKKSKNPIFRVNFGKAKEIPSSKESEDKKKGLVKWGNNNLYPEFLIELFEGSAWHQGIIKSKVNYIAGMGVESSSDISKFILNTPNQNSIDDVVESMAFDYELFNGFCTVGHWNETEDNKKVVYWEHYDFEKVRTSTDGKKFFYSEDWSISNQSFEKTGYEEISPLNLSDKTGKFMLYYKQPVKKKSKEGSVYPSPFYVGGINAIKTDVEIGIFHLNEIISGFTAGTIINLANGQSEDEDENEATAKGIKAKTSGSENAGEILVTFSDGRENAPEVLHLNGNDLDKRYEITENSVQQNILVSHSATNPLLFGIKTEGQLGGATEILESFQIFNNTYVRTRQRPLNFVLDKMAILSGVEAEVSIKGITPIEAPEEPAEESSFKKKDFSSEEELVKELFKKAGRSKKEFTVISKEFVTNEFGNDTIEEEETLFFGKLLDISLTLSDFDKKVLNLLKDNEASYIAESLDSKLENVYDTIEKLRKLKLLDNSSVTNLGNEILEGVSTSVTDFEILYSYEVRSGEGSPIIPGSRDFCRFLIREDKFYSRAEIETISSAVGRDVWRVRGGWWNDNGQNKPFCRHIWQQNLVRK